MSYRDWKSFQNEISNDYNRIYQDNELTSSSYQTTYSNAVSPVVVVVAVLGCGSLLFCLIVVCCCCCKRTTRGRVLVPAPAGGTALHPTAAQYKTDSGASGLPQT